MRLVLFVIVKFIIWSVRLSYRILKKQISIWSLHVCLQNNYLFAYCRSVAKIWQFFVETIWYKRNDVVTARVLKYYTKFCKLKLFKVINKPI